MSLKKEDSGAHSVSINLFGTSKMNNVNYAQQFSLTVLMNASLMPVKNAKLAISLEMTVIVTKSSHHVKNMIGMTIMDFTALNVRKVFSSLLMHLM